MNRVTSTFAGYRRFTRSPSVAVLGAARSCLLRTKLDDGQNVAKNFHLKALKFAVNFRGISRLGSAFHDLVMIQTCTHGYSCN